MRDLLPHILIVDDDPSIHEALEAALSGTYVVHTAATGDHACTVLRNHSIAAIILDAVLGEEDGLDLIGTFQALSDAPILVLTGYGTEALAVRAFRLNASDYLKKPVSLHELHTTLARLIPQKESPPDPVEQIRHYLDTHLEDDVRLEDLGRQLGWSEGHLCRRFLEAYGKTPRQYLTEVRLDCAASLLRTTGRNVEEIAFEVGCADLRWFRRLFKHRFGRAPSEYRQPQSRPENRDGEGRDSPENGCSN